MQKQIKKTYIGYEYDYFCDECGSQMERKFYKIKTPEYKTMVGKCNICGKDLCIDCVGHEEENGDYTNYICKTCWGIYDKYDYDIKRIKDQLDDLEEQRYNECIETFKNNKR